MKKNFKAFLGVVLFVSLACTACKKDDLDKVPVVEAGAFRVITLPIDTVTLSGTATDQDGYVTAYLWSQVSGPAESDITNPGSASSLVNYRVPGTYLYQLMAVDDEGATGLDTVSVLVNPSLIDTLSLQPAQNSNEVMIWGNSTNLEESWNESPETGAADWTSNADLVSERGALQFDLSGIPQNATIISAQLFLYSELHPINGDLVHANAGSDNSLLIQQITEPWVSANVKWVDQPASTSTGQIIVPSTTEPFLDINVDVKSLVSNMVSQQQNYGFLIKLQTEQTYTSRLFSSSFATDASKHPKLVVVYTVN